MYSLQALARVYVHVLFSVRAACHMHIKLSILVLLCMQEHTVGSQCIVSFCFILILLQPLILALIEKRIESGHKGQLKFKPNEKSKEDTVYAQGCDLLPQFFREAEDYLFKSYRNFENISSTISKSSKKPTVALLV